MGSILFNFGTNKWRWEDEKYWGIKHILFSVCSSSSGLVTDYTYSVSRCIQIPCTNTYFWLENALSFIPVIGKHIGNGLEIVLNATEYLLDPMFKSLCIAVTGWGEFQYFREYYRRSRDCIEFDDQKSVLENSLTRAQDVTTIIGPEVLYYLSNIEIEWPDGGSSPPINLILIGENHVKFTRGENSFREMTGLEFLVAATQAALNSGVCLDVYFENCRIGDNSYLHKYDAKTFQNMRPLHDVSMLFGLRSQLAGCIKGHEGDIMSQPCILGCSQVRVHDVDLRLLTLSYNDIVRISEEQWERQGKDIARWFMGAYGVDRKYLVKYFDLIQVPIEKSGSFSINFEKAITLIRKREKALNSPNGWSLLERRSSKHSTNTQNMKELLFNVVSTAGLLLSSKIICTI